MLLSLLGVLHCFWGAQFIGFDLDFHPLISNRSVPCITAKLDRSDWFQLKLAIQGAPPRLGDANWASNLMFLLLWSWFRFSSLYRDFYWISSTYSFTTDEERRFKVSGRGLRTPKRRRAPGFSCAEFMWRMPFKCGSRLSGLMRQRDASVSPVPSRVFSANGRLHLNWFSLDFLHWTG